MLGSTFLFQKLSQSAAALHIRTGCLILQTVYYSCSISRNVIRTLISATLN